MFVLLLQALNLRAQDSTLVSGLVRRIAAQQVQQDQYFFRGSFPSYFSKYARFSTRHKDNNIFYNCLVAYVLKDVRAYLDEDSQALVDTILANNRPFFERFKNRRRETYNFWQTDSAFRFPFPTVFNGYSTDVSLPDDMDCTVLALLARDAPGNVAAAVHRLLQAYTSTPVKKVRSVIPLFHQFPAYSTWLGKVFPVVFDLSVLCNVLTFVQTYQLPWAAADSASLRLIVESIRRGYHVSKPVYASPVYPATSLILYHLARLMHTRPIPALDSLKPQLAADALRAFSATNNRVEQMMLCSAMMKWGYLPPPVEVPGQAAIARTIEQGDFVFFIANLPSYFRNFLKVPATQRKLGFYNYFCPAFNDALVLEYIVLKTQFP